MFNFRTERNNDKYATPHVDLKQDESTIDDQTDNNCTTVDDTEGQSCTISGNRSTYYYSTDDDSSVGNSTISTTLSMLKKVIRMDLNTSASTEQAADAGATTGTATVTATSTAAATENRQSNQVPSKSEEITLQNLIKPGNTAVVTGASSGIGRAACLHFAKNGMNVFMVDIDAHDLAIAQKMCKAAAVEGRDNSIIEQYILAEVVDVSNAVAMDALAKQVFNTTGGTCHILMNNAGIGLGGNSLTDIKTVERVMAVNTYGPIHGCTSFIPLMIKQHPEPGIIINTGSKQGITMPPGNLTYNMSKAALKVYTEGLEYELMLQRKAGLCSIRAALLIPGWVNTSVLLKAEREQAKLDGVKFDSEQTFFHEDKPASGAWMPSQIVDFMISELENPEKFYVVCPDNDVDRHTDNLRMIWTSQDIVLDRPPLSRWHPKYNERYLEFLAQNSRKKEI